MSSSASDSSQQKSQDAPAARFGGFTLSRLIRSRGGWALADQGVVSLGNFFTGVVLIGTLPVHDYGVFFLVFGTLVFLNSLHASLVTYPLSVRGAASDLTTLRDLAGHSLLFTLALALPLSLVVIVVVCVEHQPSLIPWAVAAMVLWQIQETVRRGIMAHLRFSVALLGDALSYLGQAALLWTLAMHGALTLKTVFVVIAATSAVGLTVQLIQLRPALSFKRHHSPKMARDHWAMGRWVLLTNLITLVTVQAMPWTLKLFHGDAEVAKIGVLAQVMGITNPVVISVAGLVVPAVAAASASAGASRRSLEGLRAAKRVAFNYGLQGAALLLPYYAFVTLLPLVALRIFSKNNPAYFGLTTPLRLFVLTYAIIFPAQVMQALFNGLGRSRNAFLAQCAFSAATLVLSLPLGAKYGLSGAVWSGALPATVYVVASALMLRRAGTAEGQGFDVLTMKQSNEPMSAVVPPEGAAA